MRLVFLWILILNMWSCRSTQQKPAPYQPPGLTSSEMNGTFPGLAVERVSFFGQDSAHILTATGESIRAYHYKEDDWAVWHHGSWQTIQPYNGTLRHVIGIDPVTIFSDSALAAGRTVQGDNTHARTCPGANCDDARTIILVTAIHGLKFLDQYNPEPEPEMYLRVLPGDLVQDDSVRNRVFRHGEEWCEARGEFCKSRMHTAKVGGLMWTLCAISCCWFDAPVDASRNGADK